MVVDSSLTLTATASITDAQSARFDPNNPATASVCFSEDFAGIIYHVDTSVRPAVRTQRVSGSHAGDDDPVGMRIAPPSSTGALLSRGQAVVVDRGFGGPDEIWAWSSTIAEWQALIVPDTNNPMVDPVDLCFVGSEIFVADIGEGAAGRIWRVSGAGAITELTTTEALLDLLGIQLDPRTGELLLGGQEVQA